MKPNGLTVRTNWATVTDTAGEPKRALELYDQIARVMKERDPESPLPLISSVIGHGPCNRWAVTPRGREAPVK
jgi:hypothetical protein